MNCSSGVVDKHQSFDYGSPSQKVQQVDKRLTANHLHKESILCFARVHNWTFEPRGNRLPNNEIFLKQDSPCADKLGYFQKVKKS